MRRRLDLELVRRGLTESRARAREAIEAGLVLVSGARADRPGRLVSPDEPLPLQGPPAPLVSRRGQELGAPPHPLRGAPARAPGPAVHLAVLADVTSALAEQGLAPLAVMPSPLRGASGNTEFLGHFRVGADDAGPTVAPGEMALAVEEAHRR